MFFFVAIKLDQSLDDNQNCSLARNGLVWMIIKKKRLFWWLSQILIGEHRYFAECRMPNVNASEVQCWVNQILGWFPSIVYLNGTWFTQFPNPNHQNSIYILLICLHQNNWWFLQIGNCPFSLVQGSSGSFGMVSRYSVPWSDHSKPDRSLNSSLIVSQCSQTFSQVFKSRTKTRALPRILKPRRQKACFT